nr:serine/threonine-protein kinase [Streptacidiphilus anmyonensis]
MRLRREDPRLVGPYRLHRRLGAGGMGVVYLGSDRKGQKVALKLIRAELAGDAEFRTRFAREVAAAARIRGGCIARLVSSDIDAERPWLATVYVPGPSLYKQVGDEGPLPWAEVAAIGSALADGLEQVHDAGVVHRDLKPSNILLSPKGPRIIDFGIAWSSGASTLTHVGTAVGSPGFLAPEQVRGVGVTGATDVFALGSTLAYAATGDTPFGSGSSEVMLYRVVHEEPDLTGVPAALAPLIRACLAKDPADRPTPAQVHHRLRELAARGAAIGRSIAPQAHGHGTGQGTASDGVGERAERHAEAHAAGHPAGSGEAHGEPYGDGQVHGVGSAGGPGVGVGLGERQVPARGAAGAEGHPQAGVPRSGAGTAGRSGTRPGAGPGAGRPPASRRPLPPTVRETVEHPAPARRTGEPSRRPTPAPGARTPSPRTPSPRPARKPSGGPSRTPPPVRPGGPAARRRLLRQRLIVFITVTLGVALAIATAQGCENRTAKGSGPVSPSPQGVRASAAAPASAQDASAGLTAVAANDPAARAVAAVDWGSRSYQDPADGSRIDLSNGHGTAPGAPVTLTTVLPARYQGETAAVVVLTRRDRAVPEDMIELYRVRSGAEPVLLAAHATTGDPNGTSVWQIQNGAVLREERTPQSGGRTVSTTRYTVAAKGTMTETWPGTGAASSPAAPSASASASGASSPAAQALGSSSTASPAHG